MNRTALAAVCLLFVLCGCPSTPSASNPPAITAVQPAAGPSGTLVTVRGDRFGNGGSVLFDGVEVATQGTGSPLVFTVPYGATTGNHTVAVRIGGVDSATAAFQVTSTQPAPAPSIDGFEVGYMTLGPAGDENVMDLVLFGTGFDTNCVIELSGSALPSGLPGVPAGSLLGLFSESTILPGFPTNLWGRAIASRMTQAAGTLPALGATLSLRVRNTVTNAVTPVFAAQVPARDVLVELDRIDSVGWPPVAILRNGIVNTVRRPYTDAGLLIDSRFDAVVPDPQAGAPFSDADVSNFFAANDNLRSEPFPGQMYFHVSLLSSRVEANPNFVTLGRMFDTQNREGMVVFTNNMNQQQYLRTLLHEMGHGFNLSHCEGDATRTNGFPNADGTTIMNQGLALGANFVYQFSAASRTHLTTHPANEVEPGSGNMAFNSAQRIEGACNF